jgi:mannosyltransferase OCH1-like enzyme
MYKYKMNVIKNNYYIIDNHYNDDFHISIYYISNNKFKIIIRRLDCYRWGQDLKIKIMSLDNNNFEKISLGSCEDNFKIMEIYTNIILEKVIYSNQIIPKIIIQTSNEPIRKNIFHHNAIVTLIELNPEYEYKFFNDNECRIYIKDNLPEFDFDIYMKMNILKAYDLIIPGAIKADFFRYFYLYVNGGCYFDCKMILKKNLSSIINSDDKIILCRDDKSFHNGIILIEQKNELMLNCLKECIGNILNKNRGNNPHDVTGTDIFYKHFKDSKDISLKLIKKGDFVYFNENIFLKTHYKDYYHNYNNTERDFKHMWNINLYFYIESNTILNYKFYLFQDQQQDKFEISGIENNIFKIKRIDSTCGWGQFIKVKVINEISNIVYYIDIGDSKDNEKIFAV